MGKNRSLQRNKIRDVKILSCCLSSGIRFSLKVDPPIDIQKLSPSFVIKTPYGGLFKKQTPYYLITGNLEGEEIEIQFPIGYKKKALEDLEKFFPGIKESYYKALEERKEVFKEF